MVDMNLQVCAYNIYWKRWIQIYLFFYQNVKDEMPTRGRSVEISGPLAK